MDWIRKDDRINLATLVGLILVIAALTIWFCTIMEIQSLETSLATQDLGVKVQLFEEALQRLKNAYVTTIIPASGILTISGVAVILGPKLIGSAQNVSLRTRWFTLVEDEAVSRKNDEMKEPRVVLQNLVSEEANLKEEMKKLEYLREKWQLKVEKEIESKRSSIRKLRAEINDLKFLCEELSKSSNPDV
jgi:hypothetical protein